MQTNRVVRTQNVQRTAVATTSIRLSADVTKGEYASEIFDFSQIEPFLVSYNLSRCFFDKVSKNFSYASFSCCN